MFDNYSHKKEWGKVGLLLFPWKPENSTYQYGIFCVFFGATNCINSAIIIEGKWRISGEFLHVKFQHNFWMAWVKYVILYIFEIVLKDLSNGAIFREF